MRCAISLSDGGVRESESDHTDTRYEGAVALDVLCVGLYEGTQSVAVGAKPRTPEVLFQSCPLAEFCPPN